MMATPIIRPRETPSAFGARCVGEEDADHAAVDYADDGLVFVQEGDAVDGGAAAGEELGGGFCACKRAKSEVWKELSDFERETRKSSVD